LFPDSIVRTVKIETSTVEIEERGVKLRLTIVDTPGYGDGMDNKDRYALCSFCKVLTTSDATDCLASLVPRSGRPKAS